MVAISTKADIACTEVAAGVSLLEGTSLEYGDVVSLSPLLPEHTHEVDEIHCKLLPAQDPKGKGKMKASSDEAVVALLQDTLGTFRSLNQTAIC